MIRLKANVTDGGLEIFDSNFPDNTPFIQFPPSTELLLNSSGGKVIIDFQSQRPNEIFTLYAITRQLQDRGFELSLNMFYVPNARQDRIKEKKDVFTLKYFCEIINSLHYKKVLILDPHSNVTPALLNNVEILSPRRYIMRAIERITKKELSEPLLFFPDEGAMKRYSDIFPGYAYWYGMKTRDWETGKIKGYEVRKACKCDITTPILMVDDICSYGGTFYQAAKELRKHFTDVNIYLYVTHCETNILKGDLYKSREKYCTQVYTTASLPVIDNNWVTTFTI